MNDSKCPQPIERNSTILNKINEFKSQMETHKKNYDSQKNIQQALTNMNKLNEDMANYIKQTQDDLSKRSKNTKTMTNDLEKYQENIDKNKNMTSMMNSRVESARVKKEHAAFYYTLYLTLFIVVLLVEILIFIFVPES
tara:strand:+ start:287 stop:703 length:417 start_codon:yes stop_codon:yes gene_type:complete